MTTKVHTRMIDDAVVNVRDFGAVGDGIADDTLALKAALSSLVDGDTLELIDNMRVNINSAVYDGPRGGYCEFRVENLNNVTIKNGSLIMDKTPSTFGVGGANDYSLIFIADCEDFTMHNVKLVNDGQLKTDASNAGEHGYGVHLVRCKNVNINSCKVYNAWADNIFVRGFSTGDLNENVRITNCHLANARRANIVGISCDGLLIDGNTMDKYDMDLTVSFRGWIVNFETNGSYNTCRNVTITNNLCKFDHGAGLRVAGAGDVESEQNINISNNTIEGVAGLNRLLGMGDFIISTGNNTLISNNIIRCASGITGITGSAITTYNRFHKDTTTTGNVIEANSTGVTVNLAISVANGESTDPTLNQNLIISNNTQKNVATGSIRVTGNTDPISQITISDNNVDFGSTQNLSAGITLTNIESSVLSGNNIRNDNLGIQVLNSNHVTIQGGFLLVNEAGIQATTGTTNIFIDGVTIQSTVGGNTQLDLNSVGNGNVTNCTFRSNTGPLTQCIRLTGTGFIYISGNDFMGAGATEWTSGLPSTLSSGTNRDVNGTALI